jgi:hypothetical protein
MPPPTPHTDLKYAAFVEHVKEVTLYGTADLDFWTKHLALEGLRPSINNGRAEVLIGATDLKWRGFHFNEFTLSIGVQPDRETDLRSGFYLPQAFNSSRLLAFSERALFKTPYANGAVTVTDRLPVAMSVSVDQAVMFNARMAASIPCLRHEEEWFEGPIYLQGGQRLFYARLGGQTEAYPFVPNVDSIVIQPQPRFEVFQWLSASGFTPIEWRIRHAATHAKSKTYTRPGEAQLKR